MSSFKSRVRHMSLLGGLPLLVLTGCGSPDENAQKYYTSGMELVAKHDDVAARMEFLKALKYKADRVDVWRALAGVDERTKAGAGPVFNDLRRVVELDPNDLDSRIKLGQILINSGGTDAALKIVDAAKEGEKPSAPLHALKAIILLRSKDVPGAEREARRAREIDPNNVDATVLLASLATAKGDSDGALRLLSGLPAGTDDTKVSLAKIQAYARKGDVAQAEGLLKTLIASNPKELSLRGQLIQLYIAGHRPEDAERELRSVADDRPTDTKVGLDLVRFLLATKGSKVARDALEKRIKAGGDTFDYQMALAEVNFGDNDTEQAMQQLQTLANTASTPERKVTAQAKLAEMLMAKGQTATAEPLIAEILQKDQRNITGLRLRAAIAIQKGKFDSAIADLREALNDQPKSPELLTLMATAYERSGKNELADRQYADALKASGQNAKVAIPYVAFLQRHGDIGRAEDVLTQAASQNPRDVQLLTALAQIRLARQNWAGALAVAGNIAKVSDNRAVSDEIRASALAGQNHPDESLSALEDAHKAAPDAVQPVAALVSSYLKLGKPDKADVLLQQMLGKYPDNAELLVWKGQTKLAQNKSDEAVALFKAAITKQPKDANGYSALSDFYKRQKNYDGAAQVIQAGLKELPGNINLRLSSAAVEILKGDQAAAIAQYEVLLKDQPNSPLVVNNLASLLLDGQSDKATTDKAIALAERLKGANLPQFQDTYGWAQFKRGDYKNAVAILEPLLAKLPDSAAMHYHLGMSYAASGDAQKASEQFKAAQSLEPDGTPLKASILAAIKGG